MKKFRILSPAVTQSFAKQILKTKKNSPHIFFGLGVAGFVGTVVLAGKSTLKLEETLDDGRREIQETKERAARSQVNGGNYHNDDYFKDLSLDYARLTWNITKLYAPAAVVGGLSIASLTGSHVQMTRRNAALSTALAAATKAFNEYRARVREEVGVEKELDLYRNLEEQTIKVDGKKVKVKVFRDDGRSPYAKEYKPYDQLTREGSVHWANNSELNMMFLQAQEDIANYELGSKGFIFLNDVYKALGFEPTEAGQFVGWVVNGEGDGRVDFGLHLVHSRDLAPGDNPGVWLDFNVDGPVHQMLEAF